jgi:hypothetical protein
MCGQIFSKINKLPYKICIKFDTFEKFALTLLYHSRYEI